MNINKIIKTSEEISTLQPEFSVNLGRYTQISNTQSGIWSLTSSVIKLINLRTNIQITICQVPEKRCKTKRNKRHDDYSDESSYDEDDQWSDDDFYYDNEDNSLEYENEWQNYKYSCCANCKAFCCAHFCPLCYVPLMFSRANVTIILIF